MEKLSKMKLLFSVAIVFMFLGFAARSYGLATVYVSSPQDESLAVGEQIHLDIQIAGAKNVSGYELTVAFDPTALRYVETANADYLPASAFAVPPIISDNSVYVAATSTQRPAFTSEGTLATLTFEVIAAKDSTIKLMDVILSEIAGRPLAVIARNGHIVTTELPTDWDVNEDGKVNILDLTLVASNLTIDDPVNPRVDVNRDGVVNILDLVLVAQHFDAGGNENATEVRVRLVGTSEALSSVSAAEFVSASPSSGSFIAARGSIVVRFSSNPGNVTASSGTVLGSGNTRTITGPFPDGALRLTITWTNGDGSLTLIYTVVSPDTTAPTVTGGTVSDGDEDVDPEAINGNGKIEITFSEMIGGNIVLQTEGGDDVGWIDSFDGMAVTLKLVAGKEIGHETTYVIKGKVFDAAGNETKVDITFTTRPKE